MSENDTEMVQVVLRIPRTDLDLVKADTCVNLNATAVVAFIHKTLREKGLVKE